MGVAERERELEILIRAKYPLIYILSWEERRIEEMLVNVVAELHKRRPGKRLYAWTATSGVMAIDTVRPTEVDLGAQSALQVLEHIERFEIDGEVLVGR